MNKNVFAWAVEAQLPLVAVSTRDRINAEAVIHHLTGKKPVDLGTLGPKLNLQELDPENLYTVGAKSIAGQSAKGLYELMVSKSSTLVVFNHEHVPNEFFDAGVLPTPAQLITEFLSAVMSLKDVEAIIPSLGGLTIKEVTEVYRMTMARDEKITPPGVAVTRKALFAGTRGVTLVDTTLPLYWPQAALEAYAGAENEHFFLHDEKNPRLWPRGLMLVGPPGVGKTAYAKNLANQWNIPLLRLSVEIHQKYVGQSEENFARALQQVDQQEPCILLWDEVEKMFGNAGNESSGTTQKVLSQALWWLQEHRSRVLNIMTSNDLSSVPPELYRSGRIDQVVELTGLKVGDALKFAEALVDTYEFDAGAMDPYDLVSSEVKELFLDGQITLPTGSKPNYSDTKQVPHGAIDAAVVRAMKATLLPKAQIKQGLTEQELMEVLQETKVIPAQEDTDTPA